MSETSKPTLRNRYNEINQADSGMTISGSSNNLKEKLIQKVETESGDVGRRIGVYNEAPEHNKYLIYILTGYRIGFTTFKDCMSSLFMVHNETVNIWTHLFGMLMYALFGVYVLCLMPTVEELKTTDSNNSYAVQIHKFMVESILGYNVQDLIIMDLPVYPILLHCLGGAL